MDFNYQKIKIGNWLFRNAFPLYRLSYFRFKKKNDADELRLLRKILRPGMVVYDIGANIGFYARVLSKLVGTQGQVVCFEPDAENFAHLEREIRYLRNVRILQAAVSEKEETLKIYRSKLLNVDHRTYPVNNYESVEEIQAVSIDQLIADRKIPIPHVIKIDIQGYELAAFRGMENLLKESKDLQIIAEYWPHGFRRAETSAIDFFDHFSSRGYRFQVIGPDGLSTLHRSYVEENNEQVFEFSFNVLISRVA